MSSELSGNVLKNGILITLAPLFLFVAGIPLDAAPSTTAETLKCYQGLLNASLPLNEPPIECPIPSSKSCVKSIDRLYYGKTSFACSLLTCQVFIRGKGSV